MSSPRSQDESCTSISVDSFSLVPTSIAAERHAEYVTNAQSSSDGTSALASRSVPYACANGGGARGGGGGICTVGGGGGNGIPAKQKRSTRPWIGTCVEEGHSLRTRA